MSDSSSCVPRWVRASSCHATHDCVEFAELDDLGDRVAVRDSKHPTVVLRFTRSEIEAFLKGAKRGEFDRFGSRKAGGDPHC